MSKGRAADSHLGPVAPPERLQGFPARTYQAGTDVFRCHERGHGARWFDSSGRGRFDLACGDGTCYLAEVESVTLLETFGGVRIMADYAVAQRDISHLCLGADLQVADMTSNLAVGFGATPEMSTTLDYGVTQLWATALRRAGFDGIRYWARHDLEHTAACLALFAEAGAPREGGREPLESPVTEHLAARPDLVAAFQAVAGIAVLPVPNVEAVTSPEGNREEAD